MANIVYKIDAASASAAVNEFTDMLKKSTQVVGDFRDATVKLGEDGKLATGTITQIDAAGRKLISTFDLTTNSANLLSASVKSLGSAAQAAGAQGAAGASAFGVGWQGLLRVLEVNLFRRAISGVVSAVQEGVSGAIAYQIQLQQVANVTNQGGDKLDAFAGRVRNLSEQFGVSLTSGLAASQIAITSQLGDSATGFEVLTQAMRLAQATGTDLTTTTKLLTTTLQAFNLPASEAARASEILFSTAQRSRVPLSEMAAAMGRVAPAAQTLGITLPQMSALFLTISQQGGKSVQAFSSLREVFTSFLTPSRQAQAFLDSLGTSTIQASLATYGLTGFLQKLTEAAEKAPHALGDLAGSARRFATESALTGRNVDVFRQNLAGTSQGGGGFDAAQLAVAQTAAQQLRVEFEKLRNVFTADIGSAFVSTVVKMSNGLGGAQAATTAFIDAVVHLGVALAGAKIIDWIGNVVKAREVTDAVTKSTNGWSNAISAAGAAFTIAYAAGSLYFELQKNLEAQAAKRATDSSRAIQLESEGRLAGIRGNAERQKETAKNSVDQIIQPRLQAAAREIQIAESVRDAQINNHRAVTDAARASSQEFERLLRDDLRQAQEGINKLKEAQLQGVKQSESFARSGQSQLFQQQLGVEQDPSVALRLLRQRQEQLIASANATRTNPESTEEQRTSATRNMEEAQRIQGEIFQKEVALQQLRARQEPNRYLVEEVRNGERVRVLYIDLRAQQAAMNALAAENTRQQQAQAGILARRRAEQEASVATQKTNLALVESALRAQDNFRITDDRGRIRPEFQHQRDAEGNQRSAADSVRAQFEANAQRTLAAVTRAGGDRSGAEQLIRNQRVEMERMLGSIQAVTELERGRNSVMEDGARLLRLQNEAIDQQKAALTQTEQAATRIAATLQQRTTGITEAGPSAATLATVASGQFIPRPGTDAATTQALARDYQTLVTALRAAQEASATYATTEGRTEANAARLATSLDRLKEAAQRVKDQTGQGFFSSGGDLGLNGNSFQTQLNLLLNSGSRGLPQAQRDIGDLTAPGGAQAQAEQFRLQIQNMQRQLQQNGAQANPAGVVGQGFRDAGQAAQQAQPLMEQALGAAAARARELNVQLEAAQFNFGALGGGGIGGGGDEAQASAKGGIARYAAKGAFVGGPRGTDVLPYWLTPGEFVMNAASTSQFYSQLVSMNKGIQPRYAASGGPVNVGDVHIHVQGGNSSERTIRDIGAGLRREIKRGTFRFDQ